MPRRPNSSKQQLLDYLLRNLNKKVSSSELSAASGGASEWARRLRELRDEEGYQILSHRDRADLKPGQYLLETDIRRPIFARDISKETRAFVLERNGYTCQMCGLAAGDPDPYAVGRKVRLTMGHIIDKSLGGQDTPGNLRAVCTNCNEGLAATSPPKPDRLQLLRQVRRATVEDQLHVLNWLEQKFKNTR
jgi:5-methylcytosine-specific restriction endonuclease McrA